MSLAQGRISHAYLIVGPDHVGKATLARELAMALNCTAWQGEAAPSLFAGVEPAATAQPGPCYECPPCLKALAGSHPDVLIVEQWSTDRGGITDQVRSIQYASGLMPFEGRWKAYVLLNAEDLTVPAQNALLKTLEEPAATVCLILTAATPRALLPTVVSRCQQLQLRPPSAEAIAAALIELRQLPPGQAEELAGLAAGRIGWALQAAEDPSLLETRQAAVQQIATVLSSGVTQRFRVAEDLAAGQPQSIDDALELWLSWLRDLLLLSEGLESRVVNQDQIEALRAVASELESRQIQAAVRAVQEARSHVAGSVNTRLALEVLMLRLPSIGDHVRSAP